MNIPERIMPVLKLSIKHEAQALSADTGPGTISQREPKVKKILAERCSLLLMNVHYQSHRLTAAYPDSEPFPVTSITSVNKSIVNNVDRNV